jgi:hypothetical protein
LGQGSDSIPLAGAWVVLHEVTMGGGGPVDSVRTDARGGFRVARPRPDTTALYMVSAAYRDITYFSTALTAREAAREIPAIVVFDTSSTGPALTVAQRHVVVRGAAAANLSVLELVNLANRGARTRVAGEPPRPTWVGRLPAGITGFSVGQGDVSPEAVHSAGDSVVVTAAVPPGTKQLIFTYDMPRRREVRFPLDPTERLVVLLEDTSATAAEGPLTRRGVQVFGDQQFALFDGAAPEGGVMAFRLGRRPFAAGRFVIPLVVGLAAASLLFAMPLLLRRHPAPAAVVAPPQTADALARAIAALDLEHETRTDRSPEVDRVYREQRAALKARLAAALAQGSGSR